METLSYRDCHHEHKGLVERLPEKVKTLGAVIGGFGVGGTALFKVLQYTLPATVNYSNTYKDLVPITPEAEAQLATVSATEPYVMAAVLAAITGGVLVSKYRSQIKSGLLRVDRKLGEKFDHLVDSTRRIRSYENLAEKFSSDT